MRCLGVELPREDSARASLKICADESLQVPQKLARRGFAGYETESLACCLAVLDEVGAGTVLDIGANVGVFGLMMAATHGAKVHAFEPVPALADTAIALAYINDLPLILDRRALSREPGEATFYVSAKSDCSNSLRKGFRKAKEEIRVELSTVDDYCESAGLTPVFLKIDTESTEPDVLAGARETIQRKRPWILCEVLAGRTEAALMDEMRSHDYVWYHVGAGARLERADEIVGDPTHEYVNWLFAPRAVSQQFIENLRIRMAQLEGCGTRDVSPPLAERILGWTANHDPGRVAPSWEVSNPAKLALTVEGGSVVATVDAAPDDEIFLTRRGAEPGVQAPPDPSSAVLVDAGRLWSIAFELEKEGAVPVRFWIVEFDREGKRLSTHRWRVGEGRSQFEVRAAPTAYSWRFLLRFSGRGKVRISPFQLLSSGHGDV